MRLSSVGRGWFLFALGLVAAAFAATPGAAAEEGPWHCLLKRTALAGEMLTSTLYIADPVAREVKSLATFDEFDIAAAATDASGETVLLAGYRYGVPAKTIRIYRVDVDSGDYSVVRDFDYPQLPEVGVAFDEQDGFFYVAACGNLDPYRGLDGLPINATFIYRYDPTSAEITPFRVYDREFALVGAGGGALYVTEFDYIGLDWGNVFIYLDGDSGAVNYTDFVTGEGFWPDSYEADPLENEDLWWSIIRQRTWFTCPTRYPREGIRQRPIYFYSYDLLNFIGEHIEVYVNGPADGEAYREFEVSWRAGEIFYSYRRDAAVYLLRGHGSKPTEVAVTYGDGTAGPRLALPTYEPGENVRITETYDLNFDYSLLYVE